MSKTHAAAVLSAKGGALEVRQVDTPTPGPHEVLVEVAAVAFNPLDTLMKDQGFMINEYPAVLGSDVAGTVVAAGEAVGADVAAPGTRVAGFSPCFWTGAAVKYGATQRYALLPEANVTPLPGGVSFNDAAMLPMQVSTIFSGWYTIGVPRDTAYTPADKKGMLVWGAASSIGIGVVQCARIMGYTVYATASPKHHGYLETLGASHVVDYKDEQAVEKIVKAAKDDGVTIEAAYHATGELVKSMEVVKEFRGEKTALVACAAPMFDGAPEVEGVEARFVAWAQDDKVRLDGYHYAFRVWLKEKLASGEFVPAPKPQVVGKGLENAEKAIDQLREGVSGVKLIIEL